MANHSTNLTSGQETNSKFPPGMHNAYWFASFNPLSYQIILGSPMILYAKTPRLTLSVLPSLVARWQATS